MFLFPFGFINFNIFLNFVICCLFENLIKDNIIRPMFSQVLHRRGFRERPMTQLNTFDLKCTCFLLGRR